MLRLNGREQSKLVLAFISAYDGQAAYARFGNFLRFKLDKSIGVVGGSGPLDVVVANVVQNAIADGYIEDLILAFASDKPGREDIQQLCAKILRQRFDLNPRQLSIEATSLELELEDWELDVGSEELELFDPPQLSFNSDVGSLLEALELVNPAVCKITFSDRDLNKSGTGVLVDTDLVLTNYHVLTGKDRAYESFSHSELHEFIQTAQFEFGYVSNRSTEPMPLRAVTAESVVAYSRTRKLDYALIRLQSNDDFKASPVPLNTTDKLEPKKSALNILHHPAGSALKAALSNNGVVKVKQAKGLVLYVNETDGGSSGSPCFDEDWQLIALHHSKKETSNRTLNEGILFSEIYKSLIDEFELELPV
ncbi:hypothetical protein Lepto7375DRAFT_0921 [Leptolyngbya sp. PCC 7375]|nr:hypothetical protein Lepto7375DRAFT_0921 [Leptolyngbya sp. PCC 7375]